MRWSHSSSLREGLVRMMREADASSAIAGYIAAHVVEALDGRMRIRAEWRIGRRE